MRDGGACEAESPSRRSMSGAEGCVLVAGGRSWAGGRRALRQGAEKISRTLKSVRTTFGNLSQHLGLSRRRRHRLTEVSSPARTPCTPGTPQNKRKQVLGRTPTKLYSPFGIETPHYADHRMSPYMPDTPDHGFSPKRSKGLAHSWHILAKKRPRALFP